MAKSDGARRNQKYENRVFQEINKLVNYTDIVKKLIFLLVLSGSAQSINLSQISASQVCISPTVSFFSDLHVNPVFEGETKTLQVLPMFEALGMREATTENSSSCDFRVGNYGTFDYDPNTKGLFIEFMLYWNQPRNAEKISGKYISNAYFLQESLTFTDRESLRNSLDILIGAIYQQFLVDWLASHR